MGRTTSPASSGLYPETMTSKDNEDWQNIDSVDSDASSGSTSEPSKSPSAKPSNSLNDFQNGYQLPLQSLVLDTPLCELPVNFLGLYLVILEKFPGPPCEALGRTISYLVALVTQSPGFHPFISHMPFGRLPLDKADAVATVEALEKNLIRILQNLLRLFPNDPNIVQRYLATCPAELIPPPRFVILPNSHPAWLPKVFPRGVDGFNNNTKDGELVWQSPQYQKLQESILSSNMDKCRALIQRTNFTFVPLPRRAQPTTSNSQHKPSAPFSNSQARNTLSTTHGLPEPGPVQRNMLIPTNFQNADRNLAVILTEPSTRLQSTPQMQVPALPQPYVTPTHRAPPFASPIPTMRIPPQPSPQTSLSNASQEQLKREIERLEKELSRLAELVNRSDNKQ